MQEGKKTLVVSEENHRKIMNFRYNFGYKNADAIITDLIEGHEKEAEAQEQNQARN